MDSLTKSAMKNAFSPKIIDIKPLDDYQLLVTFEEGSIKRYDCIPLLQKTIFQLLSDKLIFCSVRISPGGYGVEWNDDVGLSGYELWSNGQEE